MTTPVRVPLRIGALALLLLPTSGPAGPIGAHTPVPSHSAVRSLLPGASLRYGLLWLDVDPAGANIALDGEFLDAGVWLISMAPGLHDLVVRKEGFKPWTRRIGIGPGENLKISVRLESNSGK